MSAVDLVRGLVLATHALIIGALRALVAPSPDPVFGWGRVHLMGHVEVLGQFTDPHAPTFHVRELRADGTFTEHVYSRSALWGVDRLTERETRLAAVVHVAGESWHVCESFERSRVLEDLCSKCAHTREAHLVRQAREEAATIARSVVASMFGATAVVITDEDGCTWNGTGTIAEVLIVQPDASRHRRLTEAEWNRARAEGVPLGAYRPLPGDPGEETLF